MPHDLCDTSECCYFVPMRTCCKYSRFEKFKKIKLPCFDRLTKFPELVTMVMCDGGANDHVSFFDGGVLMVYRK